MLTNHKCEHCNIMCDNATNLNIHVEKDTFIHCLEFYLKKRQKREDERLVKINFSRGYPCIGLGCEEQFENKTQLKKHMFTNHKCEHCNIMWDNANNLNIHVEKDTFCVEFYLKKRQKRE